MLFTTILFFMVSTTSTIDLQIEGVTEVRGAVQLAVYQDEASLLAEQEGVWGKVVPVTSRAPIRLTIPDLPAGRYAVAVFHDLNGNGRLDKNWMGIPQEPYGFSNDFRAKWKAPTFADVAVEVTGGSQSLKITLKPWEKQ